MSCILYKGNQKILVSADAVKNMVAQGWSTEATQYFGEPPTAEKFQEFLNLHEELKRVSDEALKAREDQIDYLQSENHQLAEDLEVLEDDNIKLRDSLQYALQQLNAGDIPPERDDNGRELLKPDPIPLVENKEPGPDSAPAVTVNYKMMKVAELKEAAARARVPNYELMRKHQLIKALESGSQPED